MFMTGDVVARALARSNLLHNKGIASSGFRCCCISTLLAMTMLTVFHNPKLFFVARVLFGAVFGMTGFHAFPEFLDVTDLGFVLQ